MKTCDYLDQVMRVRGIASDYALAKALGITRQTISGYRNKKTSLHDDVAIRVAELLGIEPGIVLIDMHAERSKTAEIRNVWERVSAGFPALSLQAKSAGALLPCW